MRLELLRCDLSQAGFLKKNGQTRVGVPLVDFVLRDVAEYEEPLRHPSRPLGKVEGIVLENLQLRVWRNDPVESRSSLSTGFSSGAGVGGGAPRPCGAPWADEMAWTLRSSTRVR